METLVRAPIRTLNAYKAPTQTKGIKLDANENTYPVPQALRIHMSKWALTMPINYYPDTESTRLRKAIAERFAVCPQNVTVGVGSDQLISCILEAFVEPTDYVLTADPSFSMYALGTALREATLIEVPFKNDFTYDEESLKRALKQYRPKVTFICQPNNPTGIAMPMAMLQKILDEASGVVVVDEAYGEFCDESALLLLQRYKNLIVLKTFSKAYGLAGARVGYALANEDLIEWINCVKPPYALNAFSEEIAWYAITHKELFIPPIKQIKVTKQEVASSLKAMGIEVFESQTNFLWLKTTLPLQVALEKKGIYIKAFKGKYQDFYRMSIGTETQMLEVIEQIRQIKEISNAMSNNQSDNK